MLQRAAPHQLLLILFAPLQHVRCSGGPERPRPSVIRAHVPASRSHRSEELLYRLTSPNGEVRGLWCSRQLSRFNDSLVFSQLFPLLNVTVKLVFSSAEPYAEEEEPRRKGIFYEDLRLKNRENYEVMLSQKAETLHKAPPEKETRRPNKEGEPLLLLSKGSAPVTCSSPALLLQSRTSMETPGKNELGIYATEKAQDSTLVRLCHRTSFTKNVK